MNDDYVLAGKLKMVKAGDYETQKVHYITVRATFKGGIKSETVIKIKINDAIDTDTSVTMTPSHAMVTSRFPVGSIVAHTRSGSTKRVTSYSITAGENVYLNF